MLPYQTEHELMNNIETSKRSLALFEQTAQEYKQQYENTLSILREQQYEIKKLSTQLESSRYTFRQAFKYILQSKCGNNIDTLYKLYPLDNEYLFVEQYTQYLTIRGLSIVIEHLKPQICNFSDVLLLSNLARTNIVTYGQITRAINSKCLLHLMSCNIINELFNSEIQRIGIGTYDSIYKSTIIAYFLKTYYADNDWLERLNLLTDYNRNYILNNSRTLSSRSTAEFFERIDDGGISLIGTYPNPVFASTGVSPGTYTPHIVTPHVITIDAKGRINGVSKYEDPLTFSTLTKRQSPSICIN